MSRFLHRAKRIVRAPVTLYAGLSTGSLTLTGSWPATGSRLSIVASAVSGHTDCAGTILIAGTETITFTQAGRKTSSVARTSLPAIVTSNMDCWLVITVLDSGMAPVYEDTETTLPCKIEIKSKSVPSPQGGWTAITSTQMQVRGEFDVGDMIKFDIDHPFDPTNGIEHPILAFAPKAAYMGKENIKILVF